MAAAPTTASMVLRPLDVDEAQADMAAPSQQASSDRVVDLLHRAITLHEQEVSALRSEIAELQQRFGSKAPNSQRAQNTDGLQASSRIGGYSAWLAETGNHTSKLHGNGEQVCCSLNVVEVTSEVNTSTYVGEPSDANKSLSDGGSHANKLGEKPFKKFVKSSSMASLQSEKCLKKSNTLEGFPKDNKDNKVAFLGGPVEIHRVKPVEVEPVKSGRAEGLRRVGTKDTLASVDGGEEKHVALVMCKVWKRELITEKRDPLAVNPPGRKRASSLLLGLQLQQVQGMREKLQREALGIIEPESETEQGEHIEPVKLQGLDRFAIAPNALRRVIWNSSGLLGITWDLIIIPLQVFDFKDSTSVNAVDFIFTLYWTVDVILNFFTGFYCRTGTVEMRVAEIARNYLKTWFFADAGIVMIDWFVFIAQTAAANLSLMRVMKSLRMSKSLRLLRLTRLAKVDGLWADIMKQINSEEFATLAVLAVRLVSILVCSHWIACAWYAQSLLSNGDTWVTHHIPDEEPVYEYLTALHWTLTQFTTASMEVHAHTWRERAFSIIVLIFGLLVFTSLISRISSAMSHLQALNSANFTRQHMLRTWLRENAVSMTLVARVWACVTESSKQHRRTPQKDVALLAQIPSNIMGDLYHEIFEPLFQTHPFLGPYLSNHGSTLRQVCKSSVMEMYLFAGNELFAEGEVAKKMFFLRRGIMMYDCEKDKLLPALEMWAEIALARCKKEVLEHTGKKSTIISVGSWVSEVALWAEWTYRGPCVAAEYSESITVAAEPFRDVLRSHVMHDHMLGKYASLFTQRAAHEFHTLDIWFDTDVLEDLAWCAFQEGVDYSVGLPAFDTDNDEGEDDDETASNSSGGSEEIKLPPASTNHAGGNRAAESDIARWHARVRALRQTAEEEEQIEFETTGWKWAVIMPKLRNSFDERAMGGSSGNHGSTRGGSHGNVRPSLLSVDSWEPSVADKKYTASTGKRQAHLGLT